MGFGTWCLRFRFQGLGSTLTVSLVPMVKVKSTTRLSPVSGFTIRGSGFRVQGSHAAQAESSLRLRFFSIRAHRQDVLGGMESFRSHNALYGRAGGALTSQSSCRSGRNWFQVRDLGDTIRVNEGLLPRVNEGLLPRSLGV